MAKQVVKLGLEFDTKSAIQSYRDLVSELSKGGADPKAIKQFTSAIEKAETELAQLSAEGSTGFTDSKGIEQYQKKVLKTVTSMQQLALRMQEFSKSGDNFPTSEVKKLEAEIEKLKKKITDAQKAAKEGLVKSLTTNGGFSKKEAEAIAETVKTEEQLIAKLEEEKKLRDEIRKAAQPAAEKATNAIKDKAIARDTSGSQVVMDAVGMKGKKGVKAIREAVAASLQEGIREGWNAEDVKKNALEAMKNAGISEKLAQEFEASFNLKTIETELKRVQDEINKNSAVKKYNEANKSYNQVNGMSAENLSQFTAKSKEAEKAQRDLAMAESQVNQAAINSANAQKKSADTAGQQASMAEQAANKFMQMSNAQKDSVESTEQLEGGFNRLADRLKYMFGFTAMFNRLRQIIRSTFNDIQELDKAYASIAYVTNETVRDLWSTYGEYAGMAEKLGQSTADVIKASAIYRQQGLDTAEALELTTDTMKLATIAGNDYSTATQEMTAALRGFKMEMDEGEHVSDVYSELAAHAAASVDDIAQAMSRTASIANSAGMSFENTSAFLTQMIETTQESAENIGTSMKTIIARFTELKENVAGTADSEFDDLSFNKVDEALKSVGVSLKDTTGQFRNLDEVFLELSEKWGTLDRNTQRYIATVAAGSRQQSRFIALMDNYDRTIELINTAADSEGKADEQFAKAADTIEFKLNSIKTKWEEFKLSIMNSDFVKGLLDKVDSLMDRLKNVKMPQIAIFSTFAILAAKNFVLNFINTLKNSAKSFQQIGNTIGEKIGRVINKNSSKFKINLQLDILKLEEEKLKNKIIDITEKNKQLNQVKFAVDIDTSKPAEAIRTLKAHFESEGMTPAEAFKAAIQNVNDALGIEATSSLEAGKALRNHNNELKQGKKDAAAYTAKLEENQQKQNELNLQQQRNNALGQAFTQTVHSATMAISGFASGAMSAKDAIKTFAYSSITSIANLTLSMTTSTIAAKGLKDAMIALQSTALPLLAIMVAIAAAAGIAYGIAQLKERNKQLKTEYQLQEKINKIKKLQQNVSSAKSDVDNAKQELKTTEEKIDRFKELQEMQYRTTEEQEEYNNLVEEIRSEFPSIVEYYNSITGQLTLQEEKTQKMLDMQKELVVEQQKSYAMVQNTLYDTEISKANLEAQQELEKYQGLSDIHNLRQDKYSPFERGVTGASVESKYSTFSQGISNAKKANLDSQSAIEYNLERYEIDKNTFLKQAGYGEDLTSKQWDELAEKLIHNTENIYGMINDAVENSKKAIDDERKATVQYYKDMKAASIKQTLLTEYEGLGEATAQMISDSIADKEYDFLKGTKTGTYIDSIKEKSNITAFDDTKDAVATAAGVAAAPISPSALANSTITGVKAIVAGFENNLEAWGKLEGEEKQIWAKIAEREGADNAEDWYNDIRKDPEKYKQYIDDYESMAAAEAGIKAAESFVKALEDNPELANSFEEYGQKLSEGVFTQNDATDQANALIEKIKQSNLDDETKGNMINSVTTAKQNYHESLQNNMNSISRLSNDKNWTDYVSNLTGKELEDLKVAMDKIVEASSEEAGKRYLESLSGVIEEKGPDVAASLAKAIDFTEANVYNWDNFKQNAIQTITEVTGKQGKDAEDLFNDMAKAAEKAGIYKKIFSSGDANDIEEELQAREDALYKHKEIIDKISATNKPLELSSQDLKKLQKAVSDLNAAGIDLDLSEYLDGNKLKTEEFNNALKESIFLFGDFEAAFANAENDEVKNKLKSILGLVTGFKQGVENDFSGLDEFNRKINDIGTNVDNVNSIMSQFLSDSYVNAESLKTLAETLKNDDLVSKFVDDQLRLNTAALKEWIDTEIKRVEAEILAGNATKYQLLQLEALKRSLENSEKEWDKQAQSIQDNYNQALEDLSKAQEDVIEKQKSLNDAIKEYNNLLGGSENRKSTLDLLYNYEESLKALADEESRLKDAFTDSSSYDDAAKNFKKLLDTTKKELLQWEAENQVRNTELGNMRNYLLNGVETIEDEYNGETISINLGDYVRIDENGIAAVAQDLLNAASIPDLWKNKIEEMASTYNKTLEEIRKTTDQISKKEKEMIKMHQDAVKGWADFETSIADELKKRYQEQIDDLKNKYDSMKEADDDYIDALSEAIEKQRKLREKESKYSDLAKKEKKLSLMNRDTSGANQIERLKLEQEIEKDRETLLDESINEVIDNMKLLYESQDELRQSEIELKEALLDDALYWNTTAENVASSFQSVDDYLNMITTDNKEFANMNAAQQQAFIIEQTEKFSQASQNAAVIAFNSIESIEERLQLSSEEVNTTVETTTNAFVGEMARMAAETRIEMNDTMDSAIQKIVSAQQALNEANQKLAEAATKVNEIASTINGMRYSDDDDGGTDSDSGGGGGENPPSGRTIEELSAARASAHVDAERNALDAEALELGYTYFDASLGQYTRKSPIGSLEDKVTEAGIAFAHGQQWYLLPSYSNDNDRNAAITWLQDNGYSGRIFYNSRDNKLYLGAVGKTYEDFVMSKGGGRDSAQQYKEGGLVNYTGPAWVDGTPDRPEAFLSADDTERIGNAAKLLADIPALNPSSNISNTNTSFGDTNIEINLNIDHISSDVDVDEMLERVKQEIVDVARPIGTNVILQQQA